MPAVTPIPTRYAGYLFRSRLEARWAVFFDALGIAWEYESDGYVLADGTHYLPDFWLPQVRMFAEVKPATLGDDLVEIGDEAMRKAIGLVEGTGRPLLILDGVPRVTNYWAIVPEEICGWTWEDVFLSEGHRYHLTEHRFYMSTGTTTARHHAAAADFGGDECPGVNAARAARFDRETTR
jgi:hypothetical protein